MISPRSNCGPRLLRRGDLRGRLEGVGEGREPPGRAPREVRAPRPRRLASRRARGRSPEAPPAERHLLFHVNFGVPEEYEESHIPGALYLDTNWLEDSADWNRRPPSELEAAVQRSGSRTTRPSSSTAATPRGTRRRNGPAAGPARSPPHAPAHPPYCGVDDVRLLDGGYDHWVQAGTRSRRRCGRPPPWRLRGPDPPPPGGHRRHRGGQGDPRRPRGRRARQRPHWREHIGKVSGYNYIGPAGRIAGDVWGNCGTDAYHMQHYRNVDNTMRAYPEIAANWERPGSRPTSGSPSTAGPAGARARPGSTPASGLAADRGLRRRLVRVEQRPGEQPDRDRARGERRRVACSPQEWNRRRSTILSTVFRWARNAIPTRSRSSALTAATAARFASSWPVSKSSCV